MSSLRSSRWAAGGGENKKPTSDNSNLKSYLRNFDFNLKSTISSGSSPTFGASTPLNPRVNALESPSLPKALEQKGTIVQASPTPEDAFARKRAESFKDKIHAAAASALGRNTSGSPAAYSSVKPGAVISDKTNALPVNALAFTLRSSSLHSTTPSPPPQEPTATTTESGFSRSNLFTRPHALPAKPTVGSFSPPGKRIASSSLPAEQANKRVAGVHDAKMILGATKENGAPPAKLDAYALKRQEDERRIAAIELEQERKREEAQKAKQQEIEAQEEREAELRKRELARVQEAGRRREEEEREAKEQVARKAEEERLAKEQAAQKAEEEREAQRKESERKKAEEEAAASKAAEEKGKAETEERAMLLADPSKLVAKLGSQVSTQAKLQTTIKDVTELELTLENAEKSFEEAREKVAGAEVELEKAQMAVEEAKEDFETHRQQVIDTENKLKELKDALHGLAIAAVDELEAAEAAATAKAEALKKQQASTSSPMARFNPNRYKSNGMSKTPTKAPPLPYGDPLASAHKAMSEIERQHEKVETEDQLIFKAWPKQAEREYPSEARRVRISGFPLAYSTSQVLSLVWGGRVEKIIHSQGQDAATVIFMAHDDCMKYFNDCANGIPIPEQPKAYAEVDLSDRNEPSHEFLRGAVASTLSRCVRAIGVDSDWGMAALMKMAGKGGRKVERVVNGTNPRGHRVVEFRFTNINDAYRFKAELVRSEDFETANIIFGDDPCAKHSGVHTGVR